jgi:hypothetical protein
MMGMEPIVVRFRWTADDLVNGYRYHFRHSCRPMLRFCLNFMVAFFMLFGLLSILKNTGLPPYFALCLLIGGIYWFVFWAFALRWITCRRFKKRPDQDIEIQLQFETDRISAQSNLGQSEFVWQAYSKMVQTPVGVMLYPNDQVYYMLPRRGFAGDAEYDRFVALAKSNIKRHFEVA